MTSMDAPAGEHGYGSHAAPPREFMEAVRYCFFNYARFSGRASRSEFWWFVLFNFVASIVLGIVDAVLFGQMADQGMSPISSLYSLVVLVPSLAVGARRLHDIGRTGWWQLIALLPLIGIIVLIVFWVKRGTPEATKFG